MLGADLLQRLRAPGAAVGVVGLGYVGLPRALSFVRFGLTVCGVDIDPVKVAQLRGGHSPIRHIAAAEVAAAHTAGLLRPTTDVRELAHCPAVVLCVPTPLDAQGAPDLQFVVGTARSIAPHLQPHTLVVLESTTRPGTTDTLLRTTLEAHGPRRVGADLHLAYSPEREDPGRSQNDAAAVPKVVSGTTGTALELCMALYRSIDVQVVPATHPRVAELSKLCENVFRSVNIALVNELKMVADALNIDIWEALRLAATKPFGYMAFAPGPGTGGHCIPIDPIYLSHHAAAHGCRSHLVELAAKINARMPAYVLQKLRLALGERPLRGAHIFLLGVAYKRGVDDVREAPAFALMQLLREAGAVVRYHDPFVPQLPQTRRHHFGLRSTPLSATTLAAQDAVVVITDHSEVDYAWVVRHAELIIDTRNVCRPHTPGARVVRA